MRGKSTSSKLFLFWAFALFFGLHPLTADAVGDISSTRQEIETLIKSGRVTEAQTMIEQLKVDFSEDSQLPYTLYQIGRRCEWSDKHAEARNVYQQLIQDHPDSSYADKSKLGLARAEVFTLIISGKYDQAGDAVNKLKTDFAGNSDLPDTLYWIGKRYEWSDKYDMAGGVFQQIIQEHPNTSYADRARLSLARKEVYSLIISGKYDQAENAVNKLTTDFVGNSDLPDTLYWIGRRYEWSDEYDRAGKVFQHIMQEHSGSLYADKAKLSLAREEVYSLIISGNHKQAEGAINKLKTDFAGSTDLPDTLYWIAERYRWGKKYEKAKLVYEQIVRDYPKSGYADKAKMGIARADILSLIAARNYGDFEKAIDKLVVDFSGHPGLPGTLYWIADELQWGKRYARAKQIYEQTARDYPDSRYVSEAKLGIARMAVTSLIESRDYLEAQKAFDKLVTDFTDHPELPDTLYWLAEKYEEADKADEAGKIYHYMVMNYPNEPDVAISAKAHVAKYELYSAIEAGDNSAADSVVSKLGVEFSEPSRRCELLVSIAKSLDTKSSILNSETQNSALAASYALKVISILENRVLPMNPSEHFRMEVYYHLAESYNRLGVPSTAREYYRKLLGVEPQEHLACYAQHMIARCMEQELRLGLIPESEAIPKMRQIHRSILSDYPSCKAIEYAQDWIDNNTN